MLRRRFVFGYAGLVGGGGRIGYRRQKNTQVRKVGPGALESHLRGPQRAGERGRSGKNEKLGGRSPQRGARANGALGESSRDADISDPGFCLGGPSARVELESVPMNCDVGRKNVTGKGKFFFGWWESGNQGRGSHWSRRVVMRSWRSWSMVENWRARMPKWRAASMFSILSSRKRVSSGAVPSWSRRSW